MGHDVTLFASGDSDTSAELAPMWPCALRFDATIRDAIAPHMLHDGAGLSARAREFDVLHFHLDYWPFSLFSRQSTPFVTTLHGRLDLPELQPVYDVSRTCRWSRFQTPSGVRLPQANFIATVHHGLPVDLLTPRRKPSIWLSSVASARRSAPDRAIRIARAAGMPLKIAAKVDRVDEAYFRDTITSRCSMAANVELIGEISDAEKPDFLSGAMALLCRSTGRSRSAW